MGLFNLFSYNVEIHYKSCFLSKAMFFTIITTLFNVILPFVIAYRSRGFWLKSQSFFEQPSIQSTYDYLVLIETEDPSFSILCGDMANEITNLEERCTEIQIKEYDHNKDSKNDVLEFKFNVNIPFEHTITSIILLLGIDFQLTTVCPLHMQSLAILNTDFAVPPSGVKYYGDISFHQIAHLPCIRNKIYTKYNTSLFSIINDNMNENTIDYIVKTYISRQVITKVENIYTRNQNGHTGNMDIYIHLRIPEFQIHYLPTVLQELKWAWPQYLSLFIIFYWVFNKIKRFVFKHRLFMAWEVVPWKKLK